MLLLTHMFVVLHRATLGLPKPAPRSPFQREDSRWRFVSSPDPQRADVRGGRQDRRVRTGQSAGPRSNCSYSDAPSAGDSGGSSGPDDRWMGRAIRFRHNALDPDDLHDALFEGCADQAEPEAVTGDRR